MANIYDICIKKCPYCGKTEVKKNGKRRGIQHYRCLSCKKQFQSKRRKQKLIQKMWNDHIWKRQTVKDLAERYNKSEKTIRTELDKAHARPSQIRTPEPVVCVFDATHIGGDILLTARAPQLKSNLGWSWILEETKKVYAFLKHNIESRGYTLTAVILDGRRGIPRVFDDMPVQICQFHQLQIVRRKLTLRPETEAGQELLSIVFRIAKSTEIEFTHDLNEWHKTFQLFIDEKIYILGIRRWRYIHRRVRSAYLSLKRNLPYLFTYQKYPELEIPNTTNSLDGYWSRLKNLLTAHRGKSRERIRKIVTEILRK